MSKNFQSELLKRRKRAALAIPQTQSQDPIKLELDPDDSAEWYLDLIAECLTILRGKFRDGSGK